MSGVSLHLRRCLSAFIMASADAEIKCPYEDDESRCNVPLAGREIRQVRAGIIMPLYPESYVCSPKDTSGIFHFSSNFLAPEVNLII